MSGGLPPGPLYAVALTRGGAALVRRLAGAFPGAEAFAPARFAGPGVQGFAEPVAARIARLWPGAGGFFLVMAAGIAVRVIAPLLGDKAEDPAVVVLDPEGRFAVPLLSGHLGGANALAREVGRRLGATPVLTTATDAAGAPAAEVWARDRGLRPEGAGGAAGGRQGVLRVNSAWANREPVGAYLDPALGGFELLTDLAPYLALLTGDEGRARAFAGALLAVTHRRLPELGAALILRPKCLTLGAGCREGAAPEEVAVGVRSALEGAGLAEGAVKQVASVDAKAREPALGELARGLDVPFVTFPSAVLAAVPVPNPSPRVFRAVGTPSVAEAAALAASGGGRLVLPKVKGRSWTLAVALGPWEGSRAR